jgi:type VI protein secretion system component VasF
MSKVKDEKVLIHPQEEQLTKEEQEILAELQKQNGGASKEAKAKTKKEQEKKYRTIQILVKVAVYTFLTLFIIFLFQNGILTFNTTS